MSVPVPSPPAPVSAPQFRSVPGGNQPSSAVAVNHDTQHPSTPYLVRIEVRDATLMGLEDRLEMAYSEAFAQLQALRQVAAALRTTE